jgi:hypothetical protein
VWACEARPLIASGQLELVVPAEGTSAVADNPAAAVDTDPAVAAAADSAGCDRHAAVEAGRKHRTAAC